MIKEDGDCVLNNSSERIDKKKEQTSFTALVVDTKTKKVIRRINFNIAIEIPINTKIVYSKQNNEKKNEHDNKKSSQYLSDF